MIKNIALYSWFYFFAIFGLFTSYKALKKTSYPIILKIAGIALGSAFIQTIFLKGKDNAN